ncbi:hypothetical protein DYU11_31160 [Fibrisoma montanum]|uniref:Uncharacterized protein n=1 Tax=Fibrisoma montanum TaxID=2305895 RepID=A0A418LWX1_9BACT|nr:hypothetical protein [Fibrisoma montanum]RIV17703.1 hypothetical protein DYU11_31160 [Fibrisoma montanum]
MKNQKYHQLIDVHVLHQIWTSELQLALQEIDFWEKLLGTLNESLDPTITDENSWRNKLNQLHHFRRLAGRLLDEIRLVNAEVADGVRADSVLNRENRLDHQYLRMAMASFSADFRLFRAGIRRYLIAQPTF